MRRKSIFLLVLLNLFFASFTTPLNTLNYENKNHGTIIESIYTDSIIVSTTKETKHSLHLLFKPVESFDFLFVDLFKQVRVLSNVIFVIVIFEYLLISPLGINAPPFKLA